MDRSLLITRELGPEVSLLSENLNIGEKKFPFFLVELIFVCLFVLLSQKQKQTPLVGFITPSPRLLLRELPNIGRLIRISWILR